MKQAIVIREESTGRRALITTAFVRHDTEDPGKFAYVRAFGQNLKCVEAGRMNVVKECSSLPVQMFGKRTGPFLKLEPAEGWKIVDSFLISTESFDSVKEASTYIY